MTSVCIDGFNISLAKGSGIATYGRNLLENLQDLGFGTQVLYGPANEKRSSNVLNEAGLVDAERPPRKLNRREKSRRFRETLMSRFGREAYSIAPSGEVIWPSQGGGRPAADNFWASQNLFSYANRAFSVYGKETPLSFTGSGPIKAPDVMHWTSILPIYAKHVPNIYTIHDLIPLRLPHTTLDDKAVYGAMCHKIANRADHIAVVSETTRQDVIRILGVDENRITNTYQAVNIPPHLKTRPQADLIIELEGMFGLEWKGYFLHFGSVEPKKNLGRIVEAYLASGSKTPLVLIGGRAWLDDGELALLKQVKRDGGNGADRIRQYEYMPFSILVSLIRGAKATLFPSLYEGFGLPVLESMALSTAVLTSNGGALPEVAGDAAIVVDPYDVQAITSGIKAIDADEALRASLENCGLRQAENFTREAYQTRLVELYRSIGVAA